MSSGPEYVIDDSSLESPSGPTGFARVVPVSGGGRIDRSLTYRIPPRFQNDIGVGCVVAVPVRKSSRIGVVIALEEEDESHRASPFTIKEIQAVYTDEVLLSPGDIEIARWVGSYYACGFRDALAPFTPEVRALQAMAVLVTEDPERVLESVRSVGLLFSGKDELEFEQRPDGSFRIAKSSLVDALKAGGLTEDDATQHVRKWTLAGVLREEMGIRARIRHLGQESHLVLTEQGRNVDTSSMKSSRQADVLQVLKETGGILQREELIREVPGAQSSLITLVKKGYLEEIVDESLLPSAPTAESEITLSAAQTMAVKAIVEALESGRSTTFLLFGITGSGKTEVYVEACRRAIELGKRATVLVPEIALTHQAVRRFMQMFPRRIALLHSELTERERLHEWRDVRRGERDIVIGARSALFAPMPNRGLIIIDEESETAYKQQQRPRYHARDVARRMAKAEGSVLILGSATPSIESFHAASKGVYKLLRLPARVVGGALPEVRVVCPEIPLKKDREHAEETVEVDGRRVPLTLISPVLRDELERTLEVGRQAMLFLNLRGFARSLICAHCGWVARCPSCEISLAYHRREHAQICHHCGHREPATMICGRCGHTEMRFLGWGTERLETEVRAIFPSARLLRMDRDTVSTRGRRRTMVDAMRRGEVDFLLGTQMIAKGLDFPAVRLVGVISADQSLHIPDFRAAERTFQLITQVIGRAGRSDDLEREGGGIAIIQSYDPENRVLQTACSQDFEDFYQSEIKLRFRFGYPPAMHLARMVVSGGDQQEVADTSDAFHGKLEATRPEGEVHLLGPAPAPLEKLEGRWRFHFILKASKVSVLVKWILSAKRLMRPVKGLRLEIDMDPISML